MASPSATIAVFNGRTIAALFGPARKDLDMEALGRRLAARKLEGLVIVEAEAFWTPARP